MTTTQYEAFLAKQRGQEARRRREAGLDALEIPASRPAEEEDALQRDCESWMTERDIYWFHQRKSKGERIGTPDLLLCFSGHFVGCELKSKDGKVKKEQAGEMARIRKAGGRVFVARSLEEFTQKLQDSVNEKYPR